MMAVPSKFRLGACMSGKALEIHELQWYLFAEHDVGSGHWTGARFPMNDVHRVHFPITVRGFDRRNGFATS
jgi:hypothetical protein